MVGMDNFCSLLIFLGNFGRGDLANEGKMTPQDLIDTEEEIRQLWEAGEINSLLHLDGSVDGSYEQWLCDYFHSNVGPNDWVLASHRCHYVFQLQSAARVYDPLNRYAEDHRKDLIERIKAGKSMFLYGPRFICSAIVAGTASIAAGLALSIQRRGGEERVHCFGGDGAAFHGHHLEAVAMVHARKLPCTFIITDNDSSCGVTKEQRGSPTDWPWPDCVRVVRYQPKWPHAGSLVRPQLKSQTPP